MPDVVVITGGGSGIGLATAKFMNKDEVVVISGRTESNLQKIVKELDSLGFESYAKVCDVTKKEEVVELAKFASYFGTIKKVINAAGSSATATMEEHFKVNALGTVNVNTVFRTYMKKGGVIIDVASTSAYTVPNLLVSTKAYELAETDFNLFMKKVSKTLAIARGEEKKRDLAYAISKHFVKWYAVKCAFDYATDKIRVCSVSPGLIATDSGNNEAKSGAFDVSCTAERRMGRAEEVGFMIASVADERNSYLAGVDLVCDGGSLAKKTILKK